MGSERLNPRRRKRRLYHRVRAALLRVIICSLNWEVLGYPKHPPLHARVGAQISSSQHRILERLEGQLDHFLHAPSFTGEDLGRAQEKFTNLLHMSQELPWCKLGLEDLTELAQCMYQELDTYGRHFSSNRSPPVVPSAAEAHDTCLNPEGVFVPPVAQDSRDVVSERVKWESPPSFRAEDFLHDPLVKAAYLDPEVLRTAPDEWPASKPAKVRCSKAELIKLAERWDSLGACMLIPANSKDLDEAVGLFCVGKDSKHDRLIINPVTINSRMHSISRSTKELAPGCLLTMLHLEPHEMYRFNADDLSDYYYTFMVSPERAVRNSLRLKVTPDEVSHFKCFDESLKNQPLLICLRTLAMGDNLAVEIAQQAHANVLKYLVGSMLPHEVLRYRYPIPRSDFIELLAIDDHVGIQKTPHRKISCKS